MLDARLARERGSLSGAGRVGGKTIVGSCAKCGGSMLVGRYYGEESYCLMCGRVVYRRPRSMTPVPDHVKRDLGRGGRPRKGREEAETFVSRRRCGYARGGDGDLWHCLCGLSFVSRHELGAHVLQYRRDRDAGRFAAV